MCAVIGLFIIFVSVIITNIYPKKTKKMIRLKKALSFGSAILERDSQTEVFHTMLRGTLLTRGVKSCTIQQSL